MNNFFKKHFNILLLGIVILISVILRFYQLGVNPPSVNWDEASIGYNAYSLLKTGADEYGNKFPLSIRSFDDYKPPLYVYLAIASVAVFGLTEFAVRVPSAFIGVMTVIFTYLLVKTIFNFRELSQTRINTNVLALLSSFLLAISPWHLQFSRAAYEGNIGLFFLVLGLFLMFKGFTNGKLFIFSASSFIFSIYSYHSFRMLIPLLILGALLVFRKEFLKQKKYTILAFLILLLLGSPIIKSYVLDQGAGSRLSMVTVFTDAELNESIKRLEIDRIKEDYIGSIFHNRRIVYTLTVLKGYLDHWNPDFLFLHGDGGVQHHAVEMGMLYLWEFPFILLGIFFLFKNINKRIFFLFFIFLIAPLPSSITTGTPHPVRAIAMIPALHIFTAVGLIFATLKILDFKYLILRFITFGFLFISIFFNFIYYIHQYYVHTPLEYGYFWQYGYKELFKVALKMENKYDKILVTYGYDQPYIYYLFYNRIDPIWYQKNWDSGGTGQIERMVRVIGKYEFRNINWGEDKNLSGVLFIGTPSEIPRETSNIVKEIKFLDGSTAFRIVGTNN